MILPFTLTINNKPTYFVEKIWKSIKDHEITQELVNSTFSNYFDWSIFGNVEPKLHTIRPDTTDRWEVGNKIHFYINCRQKNMFQFVPVLKVKSIQKVEIKWFDGHTPIIFPSDCYKIDNRHARIIIDDDWFMTNQTIKELAINDGFNNVDDFFTYFNTNYKGKIIHWTNKIY